MSRRAIEKPTPRHVARGVAASPPGTNRTLLFALLLVIATVIAYQPAWNAGFIWDDDDYVTHNPLLTAPDGLQRIWFSLDSPSQYFPLVYTTFRAERALWGLNPTGYHWVNILLHAINALLVWRLLNRLKIPGGWLAAAIFALHPVNVESVAWISELKNVQSLFFCLLTLLAWVEFLEVRPVRWRWYGLALFFFALALFSKTTACTLPAALLLVLWLKQKPVNAPRWAQVIPFLMMGVAMGLVSMWWERHHQGTAGKVYAMGLMDRILVASRAIWFYTGKLVWPANLTFNYPLWKINASDALSYIWLIAGAGVCALVYFARRFFGRSVEVATVFYVATLTPLLGFIMLYTFRYTFVADHYQYVACIGPIALAAAGVSAVKLAFSKQKLLLSGFAGALLVVLGVLTWRQCGMYTNLETLWRTTLAKNPDSFMAHNNLGAILLSQGQVDNAIVHFERALEILPDNANAHGNLGHALIQHGHTNEALAHFQKALDLEPGAAKSHSDLAFVLLQKGQLNEAIACGRKALALQPDFAEAHNNLGWALLQNGQTEEAMVHFQKALELRPDSADTCYNLGTALLHQGRADDAVVLFQKAITLQPRFARAYNNLATALVQKGEADAAIAHVRKALEIQPDNPEAHNNLGWLLLQNERVAEAITQFQSALKLRPDFADAHHNLGDSFFKAGRANDAIVAYEKTLILEPLNIEVHNNLGWILLQNNRADEAIEHFRTVLKSEPGFTLAHGNLAVALLQKGEPREAIEHYQAVLEQQPDNAPVLVALGWTLATWPEATIRNGTRAVELAQRAEKLSGGRDVIVLRTLAAAYAESGKFADAVTTARRATELADAQSNPTLGDTLRSQLKLYETATPFRETPKAAPLKNSNNL